MSPIPPLSIEVSTRRRACVVDTDLALSKGGLPVITRICNEFDIWVVPQLFRILDETEFIRTTLCPKSCKPENNAKASEEIPPHFIGDILSDQKVAFQWEAARIETDIAGLNIYWMGDEKCESLLPKHKHGDQNLIQRFRVLTQSLEKKLKIQCERQHAKRSQDLANTHPPQVSYPDFLKYECFRDTAALATALSPVGSFILTRYSPGRKPKNRSPDMPEICKRLVTSGIPLKRVQMYAVERDYWAPVWVRTGMTELMHAGFRLAIVYLILPNAYLIHLENCDDEDLTATDRKVSVHWWDEAQAFWYPLEFQ